MTLSLRAIIKKKKPIFRRVHSGIMPQLGKSWRKPRGVHNKTRLGLRGKIRTPALGYGSPATARGLDKTGLRPFLVANINDLASATKNHGAVLSSTLGMRKKIALVKACLEKGIIILNLNHPETFLKETQEALAKKKDEKKKITTKKEAEKKETLPSKKEATPPKETPQPNNQEKNAP